MSSSDEPAAVEAPQPKRARLLRLKAVVLLPLLFVIAAVCYWLMIDDILAEQLVAQAKSFSGEGGEAEVEQVRFSIFGPKLRVVNLRAWQVLPDGREHEVAYLGEADLDVEFWPLLERRLVVNNISATTIRYQGSRKEKEPPPAEEVPTDTNQPELNDYLEEVRRILQSEEVAELRDWLEKLSEHVQDDEAEAEPEAETEPGVATEEEPELGPPERAWYVVKALSSAEAKPTVVVKHASLAELAVTWGRPDKPRFANKVTDIELSAESVTSDPIAYKLPMKFKAAGNLDGEASRRIEIGLTVRFDPDELVKIEQVDGAVGIKSLDISGFVDKDVFGERLLDAQLTVTHFAAMHPDFSGRTCLKLAGSIQPTGLANPCKCSFAIWFGGFRSENGWMAMVPSGVSVQIEDFPLAPVLKLAGGSPLPLADEQATISFGTCDSSGGYGTPESALTWHDGVKVHLRLQVKGLSFAEKDGELGGLPATFLIRGLNRVINGLGGLDVIVGFEGGKDRIALDLEKPGLRAFVDAIINALSITAPEFQSMVELPFEISSTGSFGLASVNADGSVRDPQLSLTGEARHDFNDLRVGINLRDVTLKPKAGQETIVGLPAEDFCRAFNTFMGSVGPEGLSIRTRLMNAGGTFSPALESPGLRGLVDALAGVLSYSGGQINANFDLPFNVSPDALIQCESVDANGSVRTLASPGADSDDFSGLRIRIRAQNLTVSPKPGENTIAGLPAADFCDAFNGLMASNAGLAFDWGIFDAQSVFAPALLSPGIRGLVDLMAGLLQYSGARINSRFDLPLTISPTAVIRCESVDTDGTVRTLSSPGADSHSLAGLRLRLRAAEFTVSPKAGESTICGLPAADFCEAFNNFIKAQGPQGFAFDFGLLDAQGVFAPTLLSPGLRGLVDAMASTLQYTGAQINSRFNLPVTLSAATQVKCESVDEKGQPRTFASPGADSSDLAGLRLRLRAANFTVSPKAGQTQVMGLPAKEFCTAFNTFIQAQGANGVALDWLLLDSKGAFSPSLKQPGTRGLLDGMVNTLKYSGSQLNANFNLPFKIDDSATITPSSIEADGKVRTLSGPDSGSNDLKGLTIAVVLKNGWAAKKDGTDTVMGIPADYFTFAWNKLQASYGQTGMAMRLRLFNDKGEYAPALTAPTEQDLIKQLGSMVGIGDFKKDFAKLAEKFVAEFPAFQKDGLKVAKEIAEGTFKAPKVDTPKIDTPKFPWEK
jgi:hypothetical protein